MPRGRPKLRLGGGVLVLEQIATVGSALPGGLVRAMGFGARFNRFVPFLPFAVPLLWSVFRLVQGVRMHRWHRAGWYGRLCWTAWYTVFSLALWAALQRGLTLNSQRQACSAAGQSLDKLYYDSHPGPLPPLLNSSPCDRYYDLVPAWVNPTIVICAFAAIGAMVGLIAVAISPPRRHAATNIDDSDGQQPTVVVPPQMPTRVALNEMQDDREVRPPDSR